MPIVSLAPNRSLSAIEPRDGEQRAVLATQTLARALNQETLIAFVGAGCSLGLPSKTGEYGAWSDMVDSVLKTVTKFPWAGIAGAALSPDRRAVAIDAAHDKLYGIGHDEQQCRFKRKLAGDFKPTAAKASADENPHHDLLNLGVTRFITSNYDVELERAIAAFGTRHKNNFDPKDLGLNDKGPFQQSRLSFTQRSEVSRLARFGLAKSRDTEGMVFHCHGRYDDPESMIIGERDYQRWYLRASDHQTSAFLETLHFTLTSNPILFVGYGMGDDDLLRPLRMLHARRQTVESRGQLFALLGYRDNDSAKREQESSLYYAKYGILVIPFAIAGEWPTRLEWCKAILGLHAATSSERDQWLEKPKIREVSVQITAGVYLHHHIAVDGARAFAVGDASRDLGLIVQGQTLDRCPAFLKPVAETLKHKSVYLLHGAGGHGKSYQAMRLVNEARVRGGDGFVGVFFWSSYYADDCLTGMERAVKFIEAIGAAPPPRGSLYERLRHGLRTTRSLLVFDGVERLLRETSSPGVGEPYRDGVRKFLEIICEERRGQSVVIVTSRLLPVTLLQKVDTVFRPRETVDVINVGALDTESLIPGGGDNDPLGNVFAQVDRERVDELCALLEGHTYGLTLARAYMESNDNPGGQIRELSARLSRTPPERRVSRMIEEALGVADRPKPRAKLGDARAVLERAATFMSPIERSVLRCCVTKLFKRAVDNRLNSAIEALVKARLLFKVAQEPAEAEVTKYTVHPLVREFVYRRLHHAPGEALPNFALTGVTSATSKVFPGDQGGRLVREVIDDLLTRANEEVDSREKARLLRAAFGAARARMEANTAARWTNQQDYFRRILAVADLARSVPGGRWRYCTRGQEELFMAPDAPFFGDELAWLYNDLGLSLCLEGSVRDAYDLWEQGFAINRLVDSDEDGGQYVVQSLLHMGHLFIEIGHLDVAEGYLRQAREKCDRLDDPDYRRRIGGYSGLLAHLRGDWRRAMECYRMAVSRKGTRANNDRSDSIFLRHQADLHISLKDLVSADRLLKLSRAHAEHGGHIDQLAYARNTEGHIERVLGHPTEAHRAYAQALSEARRLGIRKLESEVLSEQSRLALDMGDTQAARHRALESLGIANELGLGLRQTQGLIVLGLATVKAGDVALGEAYLRHAKELAASQGYSSRLREIEDALFNLKLTRPSTDDVEGG